MANCGILPRGADPNTKHFSRIRRREAKQLVADGYAVWIKKHVLAQYIVDPPKSWGVRSRGKYIARLGEEYKYGKPVFVQGGLTRTETQPAKLSTFSGARVGHQ